jgi:hypothetical protein
MAIPGGPCNPADVLELSVLDYVLVTAVLVGALSPAGGCRLVRVAAGLILRQRMSRTS